MKFMLDYTLTSLHFKLLSEIGSEGRNSTVHIAHDFQLDTEIVVKRINKTEFKNSNSFFDEAKRMYSSTHPNIAPIQYSCQDDDFIYITMPLFKNGSLNALINKRPLKPSEIIKYSIDFLSGLHHIHTKKLIHCDIKPTNILISNSNDAVLTDFGLAKYLDNEGYTTVDKFYHLHRAPETLQTNIITHQSDIFQAGLTVYRLCNGNSFFMNQMKRFTHPITGFDDSAFQKSIFEGKFPDRTSYLTHIPQKLRNYVRKALAIKPSERYSTVLDFLNDLSSIEIKYDWEFFPKQDGAEWRCINDEKEYIVSIEGITQSDASIKTTKRLLSKAKESQILNYSNKKVTFVEAYKIAKEVLQNNSI